MSDEPILSRSPDSGIFGKCDVPITVNVSEATSQQLIAGASISGTPLSEFIRSVLELYVWGSAEIMARACQRKLPGGITRITGEPR